MPPFYDDRRTPAIHCFDEIGQQNVSLPALYNILSTKPVLNQVTNFVRFSYYSRLKTVYLPTVDYLYVADGRLHW